jgi:hypothetical protein
MNFSAANLVKCSASQLLYFALKKLQFVATPRQYAGNEYADNIIQKEEASAEKRGIIKLKDDLLFFCVDMIKDTRYIEIKMVDDMDDYEDWYLHSSIMQSTLYASLLEHVTELDTPKFRKKEGYKQERIPVTPDRTYELWFGTDKYEIHPNNDVKQHYLNKLELISKSVETTDFSEVRAFDSQFKHQEFNIYQPYYKLIQ